MFTWLDALTLAIMLIVVGTNVFFLLWLAGLPGSVARGRAHPQSDAIGVLGWLSLITFFATWPFALVWAYSRPVQVGMTSVAPQGGTGR